MLLTTEDFRSLRPRKDKGEKDDTENNKDPLPQSPILSLLYSLLPQKYCLAYECSSKEEGGGLEPVYRTQLIVDYVAGMTDSHVLKIYNMINGSQQFGLE